MRTSVKHACILLVIALAATAWATPRSWVSTRYRSDPWSSGSSFRSPVTDGHLDLRLLVENVTFTDLEFSIIYDSAIVHSPTTNSVWEVKTGLTLDAVDTEFLDGSLRKTTFTLSGNVTIGNVQYESEAILRVRFVPAAEGVMPITLWPANRYPESYNTCALTLWDNAVEVAHERKDWNDGTILFTFTDKTAAAVMYYHDINFGHPVAGFLRVIYNDDSVAEFHTSDHDKGITINPDFGAYYVTQQPDAAAHMMIFPGYGEWGPLSSWGGWSRSQSAPEDHLFVKEKYEGFYGLQATSQDITLTVEQPGLGADFAGSTYDAAMAGHESGILTKTFQFAYVDDDTVLVTIEDGLEPDFNYDFYVYKNGVIMGRSWFSASTYYPVTFTVTNELDAPLVGADVVVPVCSFECDYVRQRTDVNGQAVFEMPGNPDWGEYYDFRVILAGYENAVDYIEVYDSDLDKHVVLYPAEGVGLSEFANLAAWWLMEDCLWKDSGDCAGADMNFDGRVGPEDLVLFLARWLQW